MRPENIQRHLKNCPFQVTDVAGYAVSELTGRGLLKSPGRPQGPSASSLMHPSPLPGSSQIFIPPLMFPAPASSAAQPSPLSFPQSDDPYNILLPFPSASPSPSFAPNFPSISTSQSPSPLLLSQNNPRSPYLPSPLSVSPMLLPAGASISVHNSRKRPRVGSGGFAANIPQQWTSDHQDRLGVHLARITASCGFPFRWVENTEVKRFLSDLLPSATHYSRRQISNTLIPREVAKYRSQAQERCAGTLATIQCDGWSGVNFHHFVAFMITTSTREVSTPHSDTQLSSYIFIEIYYRFIPSRYSTHHRSGKLPRTFLQR